MNTSLTAKKRFLILTEGTPVAMEMGDLTHAIIERCGAEAIRVEWSHHRYFPSVSKARPYQHRLAVFDDDYTKVAPRLTQADYETLCGDDIDFNKINMKTDWTGQKNDGNRFNKEEWALNPESTFRQRQRGMAHRMETLLGAIKPDALVIHQGCDAQSLIALSKAKKAGIPAFLLETGFLPGHVYFELQGQHFYRDHCRIDNCYKNGRLTVDRAAADHLLKQTQNNILHQNLSKYDQSHHPDDERALIDFAQKFHGRLLFLPGQVALDSNIFVTLKRLGLNKIEDIYSKILDALPSNVGLVFKKHPLSVDVLHVPSRHDNVLCVNHLGLASIFKKVNAVVTITSNVGLEAAICGLPVLCLGKPVYSGKGFTLDWDGESDLASYLTKVFGFSSHEDAKADFLYTLKKEVLFSLDDPPDNLTRLCTPDSFTPTPDPRSPFWNKGCGEFSQYFQLKEDYARYVYQNYTYSEAMTRLGDEPINAKEQSLFSGERQTAFWRGDIDAAHKARYGFAALFLPPEGHVLDAGCGVGYGTQFLARQTPASFLAFDACQEAVDYANTVYHSENIRYTCVSAGGFVDQHLLKCQNTFDLIVAFEFLEHILSPELLIKKIKQKLSDDGVFVGSVPFSEGYPIGNHSFHFKHYDLLSLNQILDIKPDEHVRFFYQEGTTIDKKPAGKSIIFVLTKDKNKLTCLEENLPFLYHDQKEKDEAFVPAVFFLSPHVAQPTLSSGIPLRVEHQDQDFFFYGPYLSLPAGAWEVRFVFKEGGGKDKTDMPVSLPDHALPDSFLDETAGQEPPPNTPFNHSLMLDVVGDQGNAIYFEEAFELTALLNAPPIKIRVDSSDEKLEFRARRALINDAPTELPETDVIFLGVKLKRLPDTTLPEIPPPRKR